jgi:hypothetical protein
MSGGHGKNTDSGNRQRVPSLSEMGAALQQAEDEVTGLNQGGPSKGTGGECEVVAAAGRKRESGKAYQGTLEAERDALKNAKIPKADDVRGVTLECWDSSNGGKY